MARSSAGMEPSPFASARPAQPRGFFDRLLSRPRPDLAEEALRALFAARSPFQVSEREVAELLGSYGVMGRELREATGRVWARALGVFLTDSRLSESEVAYLDRLGRLLDIGFDDLERIMAELVHPLYQKAVAEAAEDGVLSAQERQLLADLAVRLHLPREEAKEVSKAPLRAVALRRLAEMASDRRLSPDELESIARMGADLGGFEFALDPEIEADFARFAELWRIENGALPTVTSDLSLHTSETCHFLASCEWWEYRTRTKRINYHGPVASIRIMKGVRYRIGSFAPTRVSTEELTLIDSGTIYITSKRVIFRGARKNAALGYGTLIGVQPFADGFLLEKARGRSPYFRFSADVDSEYPLAILTTVMAHS